MKRAITIILIIAVLAAAGYFGYTYYQQQQRTQTISSYQTSTIGRGNLTATVGATGSVRANQTTLLAWQSSGIVGEVNVQAGAQVEAGEILATLKEDSLPQNIILARSELINAQKALDDLQNIQAGKAKSWESVLAARKAVIQAEQALDVYDEDTYTNNLERAREDVVNAQDDLQEAQDNFDKYIDWDLENTTRKNAENRLKDAQLKLDETARARDLLELDKEQAQAVLDSVKAQLADAEREYERVKDGPNPDDMAALEARIAAAEATLKLDHIEAPFTGTITDIDSMAGDQTAPGKTAFRLDDLSRLLLDVRVSEVDINRVSLGQDVRLSFDAIQGKEYAGVVTEVSRFGSVTQGVTEFLITVELTDADEDVRPGMTAAVNIVVEELNDVVLVPNRAVRIQDGQRVVYILSQGELEAVRVTLGSSSENFSEMVDGVLKSGDTIVLNPPQVFDTSGPPPFVRR
jgi:HlyD family secretion protein